MSSEPVIIPPTCNILCAAEVPSVLCNTATRFEVLNAQFTMPGLASSTVINCCDSSQYAIGSWVWIQSIGFLEITARPNALALQIKNNGTPGNAAPTTVVPQGTTYVNTTPPDSAIWLEATDTWDPTDPIADNSSETFQIAVPGAQLGDFVIASFSLDIEDMTISAYVQDADVVEVVLQNVSGGGVSLASGTVRVRVFPAA